jgi:transcriptional regulator with XRE-family HTH domain
VTYAEIIQTLFSRSGLQVNEYAKTIGLSVTHLSNILNGVEAGSMRVVQDALRQAQIKVEDCLDLPEKTAEGADERKLLRCYRMISDDRKKFVLDLAADFASERVQGRRKAPK